MDTFLDEYPAGRSKQRKGPKEAAAQAFAACTNEMTRDHDRPRKKRGPKKDSKRKKKMTEGISIAKLIEGMTFVDFLITEADEISAREYISGVIKQLGLNRSKDEKVKNVLAQIAKEYGNEPLSRNEKNDIFDRLEDISRVYAGREFEVREKLRKEDAERERREKLQKDIDQTAKEIRTKSGARHVSAFRGPKGDDDSDVPDDIQRNVKRIATLIKTAIADGNEDRAKQLMSSLGKKYAYLFIKHLPAGVVRKYWDIIGGDVEVKGEDSDEIKSFREKSKAERAAALTQATRQTEEVVRTAQELNPSVLKFHVRKKAWFNALTPEQQQDMLKAITDRVVKTNKQVTDWAIQKGYAGQDAGKRGRKRGS
jgi:hypothetical protein